MKTPRVGILGGTFDPIHFGHLDAASAARSALSIDYVMLVASRTPPHRNIEPRASVYHRFAMTALAANSRDGLVTSDVELRREGPSYTALTLEALGEGLRPADMFFIIGADAFAEIETWYDYPRIFDLANFVVVSRPGAEPLNPNPASHFRGSGGRATTSVMFVDARTPDVSSTAIRHRVARGESIDGMVPSSVAEHIRRHRLYAPAPVPAAL